MSLKKFNEIKKEVKLANPNLDNYGINFITSIVYKEESLLVITTAKNTKQKNSKALMNEFFELRGDDNNIVRLQEILVELKSLKLASVDAQITKYNMEKIANQTSKQKEENENINYAFKILEKNLFASELVNLRDGDTRIDRSFNIYNDEIIAKIESSIDVLKSKNSVIVEFAKALVNSYKTLGIVKLNGTVRMFTIYEIKNLTLTLNS